MSHQNKDYQATHDYIIRQLGQHANRDDLILEVCQRMDIGWVEAEGMVEEVEQE